MSFFGPIIIILIVPLAIYLASSWRNTYYPDVLAALRAAGHDVYDFRNPGDGTDGFKWSKIDPDYMDWTPEVYREQLYNHPLAEQQFQNDLRAINSCDCCVLLLPCGRSAHTEAGYFAGQGKPVYVLIPEKQEPDLMYRLFAGVCTSTEELIKSISL